MHFKTGFTVIELMITIAVIAIIATIAAPSFGNMIVQKNLKKSTQDLVGILNQARSQAVIERRNIQVELATHKNVSLPLNTVNKMHWAPQGSVFLASSSPTNVEYGLNGGIQDFKSNIVLTLCAEPNGKSQVITISKMGTIQQIVEGQCT